jgi:redox-sensitive bicupin YhaK (pirin superfamily)
MLELVIDSRRRDLGGFEVGRVLPVAGHRMVGPFIFFDHMGPVDWPPGVPRSMDVRPHPHIGLSTLTYLFDGEIVHRDSVGSEQAIRPGEVNWMTAGRGITHSERFEKARAQGDRMHGIQSWVALPKESEEMAPEFAHHGAVDLPTTQQGGVWRRLVAGRLSGEASRVRAYSPMFYVHAEIAVGARLDLPAEYPERAAYVAVGSVEAEGRVYAATKMLVFGAGEPVILTATEKSTVILLGGEPLGERFIEWNFVSSSKDRIQQAKSDWRAGRMKLPDLDHDEFIPLPPDPPAHPSRE